MELEEALRHARGIAGECHVNSRLWDRAEMAVPHYLWTLGTRKNRRGWCSACKRWMRLKPERMTPGYAAFDPYMEKFDGDEEPFLPVLYSGLQEHLFRERYNGTTDHLTTGTCPQCGAWVQFRSIYKGHRSLWDRLFLIEYAKSAIEPRSAIVCVGLEIDVAWKHMDGLEPGVPMEITPRELCVFRYGQGADRFVREATWTGDGWEMRWTHRRECVSGFVPGRGLYQPGIQVRLDDESYRNAIAGTPFEHILADEGLLQETEAGDYYDRITFAARVAKYPCIEYLNRLGMTQLARQAIDKTCGKTLNLRGRTARQVLRLTGDEWAEAKGKKLRLTRETLAARAFVRKKGLRMNMELCAWVGEEREGVETLRRLAESPVDAVKAVVDYCTEHYGTLSFGTGETLKLIQSRVAGGGYAGEGASLLDEADFTAANLADGQKGAVPGEVMLHELVHQWWGLGNMFDVATADSPWSAEGLTVYTTYRIVKELYGEEYAQENYVDKWREAVQDYSLNFYVRHPEYLSALPEAERLRIENSLSTVRLYSEMPLKILRAQELVGGEEAMDEILRGLFNREVDWNAPYLTYPEFLDACGLTEEDLDLAQDLDL